jgi:hypothetical protein
MDIHDETLSFEGTDPVAGWERRLEVVVAPTGEAARFLAATAGEGSAWLAREEVVALIGFFERWLTRTGGDETAGSDPGTGPVA